MLNRTHSFFESTGEHILTKTRTNGEILMYDVRTNTFGVRTKDGVPKTMFKPRDGKIYFDEQK